MSRKYSPVVDNRFQWWPARICFVLALQIAVCVGHIVGASGKQDAIPVEVQEVMAIPDGILDEAFTRHVHEVTMTNAIAAVTFALDNIGGGDSKRDAASLRIMVALEALTLNRLTGQVDAGQQLDTRMKRALGRWGRYVETPDGFAFVVSNLLSDNARAEDASRLMEGEPRRFCDVAVNLLMDRVSELTVVLGTVPLGNLDSIAARDQKVGLMREWWQTNKTQIERRTGVKGFKAKGRE